VTPTTTHKRNAATRLIRAYRRAIRTALLGIVALLVPMLATAAAGDLDPGFGTGGKVLTDFGTPGDGAYDVVVAPGGKIVTAGAAGQSAALARYNTDGGLDAGFGSGGRVTSSFGSPVASASALAVQPDGKIVIAGRAGATVSGGDFLVARFNSDGSLDTAFGGDGYVLTDFGSDADSAQDVAVQPDGKIVAVGRTLVGGTHDFAISRYRADGTLDPDFGTGGKIVTTFDVDRSESAEAVDLQRDGKIVVAGGTFSTGGEFVVARYTAAGALDTTFANAGFVIIGIGSNSSAQALVVQPDGKIVLAGYSAATLEGPKLFTLTRVTSDGNAVDLHTGSDFGTSSYALAVALQRDGKIVVAGFTEADGVPSDFAVARYTADGAADPGFGTNGKLVTDLGSSDFASSLAIQEDGKLVAAGASGGDAALVRYLGEPDGDGDGIPDTQDPDTVAVVVSALPDSVFANGEHRGPILNRLDAIEQLIAAGDLGGARTELENLRRKVDGCGDAPDTNDWIVDCTAQLRVRALIDDLLAHLGP
jgi:uncharacterized delta-60 repeat protein